MKSPEWKNWVVAIRENLGTLVDLETLQTVYSVPAAEKTIQIGVKLKLKRERD